MERSRATPWASRTDGVAPEHEAAQPVVGGERVANRRAAVVLELILTKVERGEGVVAA